MRIFHLAAPRSAAPFRCATGANSKAVYASIANNIETWIEEAIEIRG